ncbi:hypothetical protein AMD24_00365 [Candidatus Xiphinematobacter sp. Idaho Grape]|nr:hypothetical protein AMD24_00365 [Candidatus Xiphinematobacter sp. Idaho Grape]
MGELSLILAQEEVCLNGPTAVGSTYQPEQQSLTFYSHKLFHLDFSIYLGLVGFIS